MTNLWLAKAPLSLASKSARPGAALLTGLRACPSRSRRAEIDERAVEAPLRPAGAGVEADRGASRRRPRRSPSRNQSRGRLVLGADQVLALGDEIFTKPQDLAAAQAQLAKLSGRTPRAPFGALRRARRESAVSRRS